MITNVLHIHLCDLRSKGISCFQSRSQAFIITQCTLCCLHSFLSIHITYNKPMFVVFILIKKYDILNLFPLQLSLSFYLDDTHNVLQHFCETVRNKETCYENISFLFSFLFYLSICKDCLRGRLRMCRFFKTSISYLEFCFDTSLIFIIKIF